MDRFTRNIWDSWNYSWGQAHHIDEAHAEAGRADRRAINASRDLEYLEDRVNHLVLLFLAALSLLKEKTGMSESDFFARVRELDLSDGTLDGKIRKVVRCDQCGAVMSLRHRKCLYCGRGRPNPSLIEELLDE